MRCGFRLNSICALGDFPHWEKKTAPQTRGDKSIPETMHGLHTIRHQPLKLYARSRGLRRFRASSVGSALARPCRRTLCKLVHDDHRRLQKPAFHIKPDAIAELVPTTNIAYHKLCTDQFTFISCRRLDSSPVSTTTREILI